MAINEAVTGNNAVAITGTATAGDETVGIHGVGDSIGVQGNGKNWHGVAGLSESTIGGNGIYGFNSNGTGVRGESATAFNAGVYGLHKGESGWAVRGDADHGTGVVGASKTWHGLYGETESVSGGAGVWGEHKGNGTGVSGKSASGVGVWGTSDNFEGVHAETKSSTTAAIAGYNLNPLGTGAAVYGKHVGGGTAAFFEGALVVTGTIIVQGVDIQAWLQRIVHLEQQVAALTGSQPLPPTSRPALTSITNQGPRFVVKGSGFLKTHTVHIRVVNNATFASNFYTATSDASGAIEAPITIEGLSGGVVLDFSANDERPDATDATGTLWSSTIKVSL